MCLDVAVKKFVKTSHHFTSYSDVLKFCNKNRYWFLIVKNHPGLLTIKNHFRMIPIDEIDWETTFKKIGKKYNSYVLYSTTPRLNKNHKLEMCYHFMDIEYDLYIQNFVEKNNRFPIHTEVKNAGINHTPLCLFHSDTCFVTVVKGVSFYKDKNIAHQKNGCNQKFFDDDMHTNLSASIVVKKDVLMKHRNKYFSPKFDKNIIQHFVEGKTFVTYY